MVPELEFRSVLVVGIVPVRVVGTTPDLVVEIIPDLVVEIVPARHVAETARTNVIVHDIDASFFIVLLLVTQKYQGYAVGLKALPAELLLCADHSKQPILEYGDFKDRATLRKLTTLALNYGLRWVYIEPRLEANKLGYPN